MNLMILWVLEWLCKIFLLTLVLPFVLQSKSFGSSRRPASPFSPRSSRVSLFRNRRPDWARVFPPIIIFFRLLSIVPASLAIISHVWSIAICEPDTCTPGLCKLDYFMCLLWVRHCYRLLLS